ncbi:MAG: hypothetical protein M1828_006817 [Chrysothrix sp. TS-e1954]|nr:MAG: hypothetical protein M1828_006817 [Chrysothrix sp. TS-e1954]
MSSQPRAIAGRKADSQLIGGHPTSELEPANPEVANAEAFLQNASQSSSGFPTEPTPFHIRKPSAAGLHLETGANSPSVDSTQDIPTVSGGEVLQHHPSPLGSHSNTFPRLSHENVGAILSPTSSISSPALGALNDVTPLPSPIGPSRSPELWKRLTRSRGSSAASAGREEPSGGLLPPSALSTSPRRRKQPHLSGSPVQAKLHSLPPERSLSAYVPDALHNERPRVVTGPAASAHAIETKLGPGPYETHLHREEDLAAQRKRKNESNYPLIPGPSPDDQSTTERDDEDEIHRSLKHHFDNLEIRTGSRDSSRNWQLIRQLGRGAFSQVVLAKSTGRGARSDAHDLVALKIVSHDQDGGTDEERMDVGVKREIEILQYISHPCLPKLHAIDDNKAYALLVLNYCSGGDLFELASSQRSALTPVIIQRTYAELVAAVGYLHAEYIVHRDIKLENVLFNLPTSQLTAISDPISYPHPLITLTDLGLSKRIPKPPQSPLLSHACGSADYAAPELLLQQPYDGRSTDVWALGVLLYALLEGRLPFDPVPGQRRQASSKHRIARCDWMWCEYGDENGEWLESKGKLLQGAREVVEGTLKKVGRGRWELDKVREHDWAREGIKVAGGLRLQT